MSEPMWTPSSERIARANMTRFLKQVGQPDVRSAWRWSVDDPAAFWPAVWEFFDIAAAERGDRVVVDLDKMPGARWFPDARLNFAANLLRYRDDQVAIVAGDERGRRRSITYAELYAQVSAVARWLRAQGVAAGDRVAGFVPNVPESIVAMLATASIGAIWSSCSPDFGIRGVLDRFGQIEPKVLFCADGYSYNGKAIDSLARIRGILAQLPSVERTVVIPFAGDEPAIDGLPGAVRFADVAAQPDGDIDFAILPFNHPLYIMYSSGTTGVPKCIVHGAGGTLIQHLKELGLHTDVQRDDRIFYFTTCGWMMWNWLVSSLALGATVVLYDGSPTYPAPDALWSFAAEVGITVFGTSAKYLASIEKAGVVPRKTHDVSSVRAILSTGSPLLPESFDYVYRDIKRDVHLASISGGTDIISCFALGNPIGPVYRGELQMRGLGMRVAVFDDQGREVRGQKGELCCTRPFPSMPIYFWNDPDGKRYHDAYFARFPNVWCHGDYAELTEHDGMIIYGRSDATLNPGGVRIGTAEIYRVVESIPDVVESIAVGHPVDGDVEVILCVVLRDGVQLTDELERTIRRKLREEASPRHVPARIFQVPAIPRTISGKIVELAVQRVMHGQPVDNRDALANPEALDYFKNLL
ncbi:MAG: acetoacetate--CoA ligase [Deltaproteobacteria bacterium]|nr:MAG: acetoacetate--CoA ligase [Deltaproteobacteria bacterium]